MLQVTFMFDTGAILKDRVTGFTGVVMCRTEYSTGCKHYGLASRKIPKGTEKLSEWEYFDESRLDPAKGKVSFRNTERKPSGPFPNPPQG